MSVEIEIQRVIASFGLFSALFIASFISLFTMLSKKGILKSILKNNVKILLIIISFFVGAIVKYIYSSQGLKWILDLAPFFLLGLFDLILLILICKYNKSENRKDLIVWLLIINLVFIVGWSLIGALFWYFRIWI